MDRLAFAGVAVCLIAATLVHSQAVIPRPGFQRIDYTKVMHALAGKSFVSYCDNTVYATPGNTHTEIMTLLKSNELVYKYDRFGETQSTDFLDWVFWTSPFGKPNVDNSQTKNLTFAIPRTLPSHSGRYNCSHTYSLLGGSGSARKAVHLMDLYVHVEGDNAPCKDEWIYYPPKNLCVMIFKHDEKSWWDAANTCREDHNGVLANPMDSEYDVFLTSIVGGGRGNTFWIGLNDIEEEGYYVWDDNDTSPCCSSYDNWGPWPPKMGTHVNCVEKGGVGDGKWSVTECSTERQFLCERSTDANSESKLLLIILEGLVWMAIVLFVSVVIGLFVVATMRKETFLKRIIRRLPLVSRVGLAASEEKPKEKKDNRIVVLYESELSELVSLT